MALTTTGTLDSYLGAHAYTAAQTALAVEWAINAVEKYCGREFDSTTYHEWQRVTGTDTVLLTNTPVTSLMRVHRGRLGLMSVAPTSAVTDYKVIFNLQNGILLTQIGTGAGIAVAIPLVALTSMALLAVELAGHNPVVLHEDNANTLCPEHYGNIVNTTAYLYGPGESIGYKTADLDAGVVALNSTVDDWVFVKYLGGFTTIPHELEQITTEMAAAVLRHDPSVKSERVGNTAFTYGEGDVMDAFKDRLGKWKRRSLL